MKLADLEDKNVLLVGLGKEGKATQAFLEKMVPSATVTAVDENQGADYLAHQKEFDLAIKSPGVKPDQLTIPYTTATNLFFALVKGKTIGVTGTKGKSTTASLLYAMLLEAQKKVHLVGNIGNPMLTELLVSNTLEDYWVCELSSYQLADIEYAPDIAVITSLFPEHMDYHGSIDAYYQAKMRIIANATEKNTLVYDPTSQVALMLEETTVVTVPFIESLPFPESEIPLLGVHNISNIRAAITVAQLLGIADSVIEQAVKQFQPLAHRLQNVGTFKGITFYDDAISTTPQSTVAALNAIPSIGTIFLGGEDRGYDFTPLVQELAKKEIPAIVLFPESGEKIKNLLQQEKTYHPQILETTTTRDAVAFAYAHTPIGMSCVMSPASPSYSLWKNFLERGDEFQSIVKEL